MEGIVPIPIGRFKLGASSLVEAIPFMGAIGIFITSFLMYLRTCQNISAPSWLWKEMLGPLIWAVFFACVSGACLIADGQQVMWRVS
ncbi:hypothetical protein IAS59_003747 [Cryptococcus gattii]